MTSNATMPCQAPRSSSPHSTASWSMSDQPSEPEWTPAQRWYRLAEQDLAAAGVLLRDGSAALRIVGFLSQQAAEKAPQGRVACTRRGRTTNPRSSPTERSVPHDQLTADLRRRPRPARPMGDRGSMRRRPPRSRTDRGRRAACRSSDDRGRRASTDQLNSRRTGAEQPWYLEPLIGVRRAHALAEAEETRRAGRGVGWSTSTTSLSGS